MIKIYGFWIELFFKWQTLFYNNLGVEKLNIELSAL